MQYQKQENIQTIEGILMKALLNNKWISKSSYYHPDNIHFQHASRTDRGVSAAQQCVSMRLRKNKMTSNYRNYLENHEFITLLATGLDMQTINNDLPDDIRVFALKQVSHNFDSRKYCMFRTYSYTLPSIAFCQYNDQTSQRDYRISSDKLKLVNELLQVYKGTKRFHNFTINKSHSDYSCVRQMKNLECSPPFLVNDVEFCVIRIRGNSFMMHQIRKMIGLLLAVTREVIDSGIFKRAFSRSLTKTPTAPGLGLVLDKLHFDEYNRLVESDGLYEKLTWEECDGALKQFRDRYIDSKIFQTEIDKQPTLEWLETLLNYPYIPEDIVAQDTEDESLLNKS